MQTTTLYKLDFADTKTYLWSAAFVVGNIVLPQLCHLVPQGGLMLLPIYFFTLVGAWKFGWKVGLLTAIASPLANSALFGMPPVAVLPAILVKSVLLALAAGYAAQRWGKATMGLLIAVVAFYQVVGGLFEWATTGSLMAALQDFRLGIPGILLQVVGGWMVINKLFGR